MRTNNEVVIKLKDGTIETVDPVYEIWVYRKKLWVHNGLAQYSFPLKDIDTYELKDLEAVADDDT